MNTQERWNYIKNNEEIIRAYMSQHDDEVKTRRLVEFVNQDVKKDPGHDVL